MYVQDYTSLTAGVIRPGPTPESLRTNTILKPSDLALHTVAIDLELSSITLIFNFLGCENGWFPQLTMPNYDINDNVSNTFSRTQWVECRH